MFRPDDVPPRLWKISKIFLGHVVLSGGMNECSHGNGASSSHHQYSSQKSSLQQHQSYDSRLPINRSMDVISSALFASVLLYFTSELSLHDSGISVFSLSYRNYWFYYSRYRLLSFRIFLKLLIFLAFNQKAHCVWFSYKVPKIFKICGMKKVKIIEHWHCAKTK